MWKAKISRNFPHVRKVTARFSSSMPAETGVRRVSMATELCGFRPTINPGALESTAVPIFQTATFDVSQQRQHDPKLFRHLWDVER